MNDTTAMFAFVSMVSMVASVAILTDTFGSDGLSRVDSAEITAGEWLESCGYSGRVVCSYGDGDWSMCAWSGDAGVREVSCNLDAGICFLGADHALRGR